MRRVKKGDTVMVIKGKSVGKTGKVLNVNPETKTVIIEQLNMKKKTIKKTPENEGGMVDVEAPIAWSNVMVVDPKSSKPTRIKFEIVNGKKHRVSVRSGETI